MRGQKVSLRDYRQASEEKRERDIQLSADEEMRGLISGYRPSEEDANEEDEFAFQAANKVANKYYNKKNRNKVEDEGTGFPHFSPMNSSFGNRRENRFPKVKAIPYTGLPDSWLKVEKEEKYEIVRSGSIKKDKLRTTSSAIFSFLMKNPTGVHITEIITFLRARKLLKAESSLHHYSQVHKLLTRNFQLFDKIASGIFAVRNGFRKSKPIKPQKNKPSEKEQIKDSATFLSLVVEATKSLNSKGRATPSQVYCAMRDLGYNGRYQSVCKAMQSSLFKKNKLTYTLKKQLTKEV